mmetsp:Transcript_25784/g.73673  ORF Transcript_25784/g.73673 Transcript_25784/m.73673 type:complete len:203 (+) Transcript_25784:796-1404(+)
MTIVQAVYKHQRSFARRPSQNVQKLIDSLVPIVTASMPSDTVQTNPCGKTVKLLRFHSVCSAEAFDDHVSGTEGPNMNHRRSGEHELCWDQIRQSLARFVQLSNSQPWAQGSENVEQVPTAWSLEQRIGLVKNDARRKDGILLELFQILTEFRRSAHNQVHCTPPNAGRGDGISCRAPGPPRGGRGSGKPASSRGPQLRSLL